MGSKDYFDHVAGQWDEMRKSFFSEAVRNKALAAIGAQPGKIAADIGAGSGFITAGLIRAGLHVIAVDQSEMMLDVMRRKFSGIQGMDFRVGNAEQLPIADTSVDYVLANMTLHHVESPRHAIMEMTRILKAGGRLVITDLDEHTFEFLRAEHQDRWMGFKREEIKRLMASAGLKNAIVGCAGESCCAQSKCGNEKAAVSIFLACGEK